MRDIAAKLWSDECGKQEIRKGIKPEKIWNSGTLESGLGDSGFSRVPDSFQRFFSLLS
jgi:hypothetical protein